MSRTTPFIRTLISLGLLCSTAGALWAAEDEAAKKGGLGNPFFAMDTGTKDARHQSPESQAALVKELGYAGIGCDINAMPDMLKAVKDVGLRLFAVYVGASIDPGKPKYDPRLNEVITSLKGRDTSVWLFMTGGKASSTDGDPRAVEIVREIADMAAKSGLSVALYPHTGFWMERVEDAVRVAKKADRNNVGVTFNLCHWLKVDEEKNMEARLTLAMPHLFLVTINGADSGGDNWTQLIQTLDRGSFDIYRFLKTLKKLGYTRPIGLQGYGIKGDARENLSRSMAAWRRLSARIAAAED